VRVGWGVQTPSRAAALVVVRRSVLLLPLLLTLLLLPPHNQPNAGEIESLNDRYYKLERAAAEVAQGEPSAPCRARQAYDCTCEQMKHSTAPPTHHHHQHHNDNNNTATTAMSRDLAERDTLKGVSESLEGERASLQRRLLQLRAELDADTRSAQATEKGASVLLGGGCWWALNRVQYVGACLWVACERAQTYQPFPMTMCCFPHHVPQSCSRSASPSRAGWARWTRCCGCTSRCWGWTWCPEMVSGR